MFIANEVVGKKFCNEGFLGGNGFEILKERLLTSSSLPNEFFDCILLVFVLLHILLHYHSKIAPISLRAGGVPHTFGKLSTREIFSLDLTSIEGLHTKLWAPKVTGVPTLGISRLSLESPRTK